MASNPTELPKKTKLAQNYSNFLESICNCLRRRRTPKFPLLALALLALAVYSRPKQTATAAVRGRRIVLFTE